MLTQEQLIRNYSVMANGEVDFLLGAGASIASGIPTGSDLVWEFKRTLYCSECEESKEKYKDLSLPSTRKMLQDYFDKKDSFPQQNAPNEYSFYFEKCYTDPLARKRFIGSIVSDCEPSLGYLCLAELICSGYTKNIWTTNFDSLIEKAINILHPTKDILVCSEANKSSINMLNPLCPTIGKLHGDYRYDWLQNTEVELQQVEQQLKEYAETQLADKQLIVIGYSGNDESIMSLFENNVDKPSFLSKGLLWTIKKGGYINPRVKALIESLKRSGKQADIVEIDSFDALLYQLYHIKNCSNEIIENKKRVNHKDTTISFSGNSIDYFLKINSYKSDFVPPCNVFETDITSWKELRETIFETDIIAALYNGHIYSFSSEEKLRTIFSNRILSDIIREDFPERIMQKNNSIYIGMIYELIGKSMLSKGLKKLRKDRFFNPSAFETDNGYQVYEAIEFGVSYIDGALYLNILPTVHVCGTGGLELDKETYRLKVNSYTSKVYNSKYNEKLKFWESLFRINMKLLFQNDSFEVSFILPAISCGGTARQAEWISFPAYKYDEPIMRFSDSDKTKISVNQLKGLCQYGPIDFSYMNKESVRPSIKLAVLSPKQDMRAILGHLNKLNSSIDSTGKDAFIPNYEGFEHIYHRALIVPSVEQKNICIGYDSKKVSSYTPKEFVDFMKRGIAYFSEHSFEFDVLVIYIPSRFAHFRTPKTISSDFNLHDSLKLYATERGVKLQIIEEKSLNTYFPCKVMWGLSTSLYAKSGGILWHPQEIQDDTAYIGISYSYSREKGICIGCSQLFDSTGTGIRMVLRKIGNPKFKGKNNPYMREDDARSMMTELREQYYRSSPVNSLKRIVIHKTTPFIYEEISGIMQAFCGIEDVELIQVQDYCTWRGIRFGKDASQTADKFAVKRGLTVQLSPSSFLLWTHGCVIHPELSGNFNYYKGGRSIPSPLLIKRFSGNSSGDVLAREILMLSKMNWNSGDSLYKALPVTLDFAKVLSRMSKQDEAIFDKAYDFRYFM